MSSYYTFCPKCDLKIPTTRAQGAKGIDCGDCGEKFWPQKVERESDSGKSWSGFGMFLSVAGLIAFAICGYLMLNQSPNDPPPDTALWIGLGAGACAAGFWCLLMGQLFHIRAALEKIAGK